ncbi:DUF2243 domain-containing protein [Amycolatopsis marina]|uniref:DUF2243 domain-containing protein n=1 Tax=Amycolatopsis marina TaxID=490629 RepID=UPI00116063DE|nr:DUF2243 domain-containing protein [Amycolatopsis marina]
MAALGEIVFHQILAWHHFYDRSTRPIGLLSSGLWHTAELLGLVAGFVLYAGTSPRRGTTCSAADLHTGAQLMYWRRLDGDRSRGHPRCPTLPRHRAAPTPNSTPRTAAGS